MKKEIGRVRKNKKVKGKRENKGKMNKKRRK
jgi:hypothetical protein